MNPEILNSTIQAIPLIFLLVVGLGLMLLDAFKVRGILPWIAGLGLVGSSILALSGYGEVYYAYDMIGTGGMYSLIHVFLCLSGLFSLLFIPDYLERQEKPIHDIYALLIFSIIGMVLLANASDLLITFIGLETMSICLYIFAGLFKMDAKSNEAGLKYFLLGAFSSGFLLFGIALIYGLTGTMKLAVIAADPNLLTANPIIFYTGIGLILVGFLFKVSAFPFHSWTPDVYSGTPTPLAGFMATGSKMASFIALGFVLINMDFVNHEKIVTVVAIAALLSMVYGNIVAARQTNLKRMLAYSSIAHSGYVLLGLCAGQAGFMAVIFYMFIYTLMNIGAFGMVGMAERDYEDTDMSHWKGLGAHSPYFAAALSVFLFSMAGIPPLAGFMAKYQVFISALRADLVVLAIIGILTSVVGAYYYIKVIVLMYFGEKEDSPQLNTTFKLAPVAGIAVLVALILLLGVYPSLVINPLQNLMDIGVATEATALVK